jgi:hypothetical protein
VLTGPEGASRAVSAVRLAVDALNAGDVDGYLTCFESRCQRWISGFEEPLDVADVGDGLRQLAAAFDGLRLDEALLFGDDLYVCARWRMRGLHVNDYLGVEPTGREIDVDTCEVYEVAAGLVITTWVYGDVLGQLVSQLTTDGVIS